MFSYDGLFLFRKSNIRTMPVCITYSSLSTLPSRFKYVIHFNSRNVDNFHQNVDNSPVLSKLSTIEAFRILLSPFL